MNTEQASTTMSQEIECIEAFKQGNKQDAERLLPLIRHPADIWTTAFSIPGVWYAELVSLLHLAAAQGWMDIIIDLITKYKCDTNCKDKDGHTPLHYAAIKGSLEVVKYFINKQTCDPMVRDNDGITPLHYACQYNHLNIVQFLISIHISPSCADINGITPLHVACSNGHPRIVQHLLSTGRVDPLARNNYGEIAVFWTNYRRMHLSWSDKQMKLSLLHLAAHHGWIDTAIDLITQYRCDINCKDSDGRTPLHYAVISNNMEMVMYFINEQHCDPMVRDNDGDTPLHIACRYDHLNIAMYLKGKANCNPSCENNDGDTPLHLACRSGHLDITQYLIENLHCNLSCKNKDGNTPLHLACEYSHAHIVQYLLSTGKVDIQAKNKTGNIPIYALKDKPVSLLHLAAHHGWEDIITKLTKIYKCDTNSKDIEGNSALHYACCNGYITIVQYLIREAHCNPSCENNHGETPLHLACRSGHTHIVQYLLSTGKADPLATTNYHKTALQIASEQNNNDDLLKLFLKSFSQCKRDYPVHTYTKLILTGYSGAGKTTISQLIFRLANKASGFFSLLSSGRVTDVECLTAGIIPLHVESKVNELGNMVIYDFAGQQEYYSSHGAVLESIMKNSAAIFVCIVDLSQCMDKISESIHYWISFIENACSSVQGSSHVIILGSHADMVKSSQELKEKSLLVESIAESRVKQLIYGGFVSIDCRLLKTKEARSFCSLLSTSQQAILSSQPRTNLYCHVLYAFLHTKLKKTGCTLQELTSALDSAENLFPDPIVLTESLISLSDTGLVLFVQNKEHPQSSWVVVEKETFLREVNGTLFAPDQFKQYRQVASNTGIVPIATLGELFPQYSSEMLVGCLESMEFCHPVDPSILQATILKATSSFSPSGTNHLFFPSLVKEHRPGDLPSPRFGWCLGCSDPHQFFSSRFLHVLLLRLAFRFSLASKNRSLSPSLCGLDRQCEVWQNGICWKSVSGVSTIVEIVDLNRWVIVLVSEKTREAAQTCSSVIRMILDLQHQLCNPLVATCECLISPSLLDRYPFDALSDTDLFDLPTVARSMLLHHKLLLDRKEGKNEFSTDEALSCEPYYLLQPSSVCQLFNQSMGSQPVPGPLLQEVLSYCQLSHQKPRDHNELRECVNKYSIFAGRNPLVSCSVQAVL